MRCRVAQRRHAEGFAVGVLLAALLAVACCPGRAAANLALVCPIQRVASGNLFQVELRIAVGAAVLGAYDVRVQFEPARLGWIGALGGASSEFSSPPFVSLAADGTSARLIGFNLASLSRPTGTVSVAFLVFRVDEPVAAITTLRVEPTSVVDPQGGSLPAAPFSCSAAVGTSQTSWVAGLVRSHRGSDPVAGVAVTAHNDRGGQVVSTTGADGRYGLTLSRGVAWTLVPAKATTENEGVGAADAEGALGRAVQLDAPTAADVLACDVSGNGAVSAFDAALLLRHHLDSEPALPTSIACAGRWRFRPIVAPGAARVASDPLVEVPTCHAGRVTLTPALVEEVQDFEAILAGDCAADR